MGLSCIPENAEETGFSLSQSCTSPQATPIATTTFQPPTALPPEFFCRPAQEVAQELIGCLLINRQAGGELLGGVVVETEAYCQCEPACHGHRRSPQQIIATLPWTLHCQLHEREDLQGRSLSNMAAHLLETSIRS